MSRRLVTILVFLVAGVSLAMVASFAAEPVEGEIAPVAVITAIAEDMSAVKVDEKGQPIGYNVDPVKAKTTRYISLHDYPSTERAEITQVIKGHLNGLNRTSSIAPVDKVGPWLLRIDTDDFGDTFARVWEELDTPDPIFHDEDEFGGGIEEVEEEVSVEYGFWIRPDGTKRAGGSKKFDDEKWETTRTEKEKRKVRKLKPGGRRLAPWLTETAAAQKSLEAIQVKVGGTKVPVVTARFFLWQTAIQKNRKPGYCDFLGYKNLKEFEFLGGVVRKDLDAAFKEELRAVTGNSTVTLAQVMRRIVRLGKVDGDYWFTLDGSQEEVKNRAKGNPLENLGDDLEFQAIEAYVHLANGMWATGLFNDKGERQDVAPQNIATDSTAPGADRNVHVNLSCIRCHTKGGMQDVDDWVRSGINLPPNALFGPPGKEGKEDREASKRLREQYVRRHVTPFLTRSRERYTPALLEATGLTPEKYAGAYGKAWAGVEAPVTAAQAARELGTTTAAYQDALARLGSACDPTLSLHRLPNPRSIPRALWHQKYNRAQDALRGKARPYKVEVKEERK